MVLSAMPVGEHDKRLVLLTKEEGKITAFARGAKRPKSTLLAASNPFVTGRFFVIPGKNAYSLVRAEVSNYFSVLPKQMPEIYYGFYFLELAGYYGREGIEAGDILNLLYLSLLALESPRLNNRLIRCVYEIRLMTINGEYAIRPEMSERLQKIAAFIMGTELAGLFRFELGEGLLSELERDTDRYMKQLLDRRIRSREILEQFL